jgi:threonine dehydrogenase-like Zn-dependent dehydrogenase
MNMAIQQVRQDRGPSSEQRPLLERIQNGEIDPSFVITHRMRLEDAPKGYEIFKNKRDNCIKVVLKP